MKRNLILLFVIFVIFGCGKNEKKQQLLTGTALSSSLGTISIYSGSTRNSVIHRSLAKKTLVPNAGGNAGDFCVYIRSLEISTTGENWIKILDGSTEVRVTEGAGPIKINTNNISVPPGEYHGVRLVIEPKIRLLTLFAGSEVFQTDETLNAMPGWIGVRNGGGGGPHGITVTDTIIFSSANGYLVPFTIENGKETYLVFDFDSQVSANSNGEFSSWGTLYLAVRGTRFIN
ncbi:MAG: hypothetical protein A2474_00160 [Elusimicrobia bacterium RIFOXYC2_FULL_34_12]|nr:MAG: hypothetical protein A2474_00160 [Elusimicrobia bacterium RIFOXYC2_FULL_34_12]HAM38151.1 hypothetical protein [Elusimicrobiota bacterium]